MESAWAAARTRGTYLSAQYRRISRRRGSKRAALAIARSDVETERRHWRDSQAVRIHDHAPCSHWEATTVVAALRPDAFTAPGVFDGPIDSDSFLAYVEQVLVPTLQPGDVVVLDNLAVHKQPAVRAAIEQVGVLLRCLPPEAPNETEILTEIL